MKTGVFTIIAKDNIDHSARSTAATKHYHGTSMTAMQFIAEGNRGEDQIIPLTEDQQKVVNPSKKLLQIPSSYTQPETFYLRKSKFYAPVCTINIPEEYSDNKIYNKGIDEESKWLDNVCLQMQITPWAKYHSEKNRSSVGIPGTNVLLPLIPQPVHTLQTQYHCMKIIKETRNFLNPEQIPFDQPVYASTKKLTFRLPNEQRSLIIIVEPINGSGLQEILEKNKFSITGTGSVVNANHIKQARYCIQVIICVLYSKLKEARSAANSALSPFEWLKKERGVELAYLAHFFVALIRQP